MEDYKTYECPKCQIKKHINLKESFDFKCKCCGGKMRYVGVTRKNSTIPNKKESYNTTEQYSFSQSTYTPKCPTCGSTDLSKVSSISKVGSVLMFGLLSQKIKKTWHCNNCKYEW